MRRRTLVRQVEIIQDVDVSMVLATRVPGRSGGQHQRAASCISSHTNPPAQDPSTGTPPPPDIDVLPVPGVNGLESCQMSALTARLQALPTFGRYSTGRCLFGSGYGSSPFLVSFQLWGSRLVATAQISDKHVVMSCASSAAVASPGSRKT